ncbi:hypothetical protein [Candidatus Finniella inopinata]|uniref:Uncharacterized protein n=1 Tax=Candidatus Finniella inopinata TaxID=1696036 RepID=A0A4Q7DIH1_9PROT|nr:hypothetical protein [Candidatus Finniella inopinata]RZI46160.1 hypothetical protein EQU50_04285 [Candidatus Finniella inopinata]
MNIKSKCVCATLGLCVILGLSLNQSYASVWYRSPDGEPRFRTRQDYISYEQARGNYKHEPDVLDVIIKFFVPTALAMAAVSASPSVPQKKRVCGIF